MIPKYPKNPMVAVLVMCCIVLVIVGCSEKGGGIRFGNIPPETFITWGPGEDRPNHYEIEARWFGADPDGRIEGFEVATVRDITEDLFAGLDYDELPWVFTRATHGEFALPADSCCMPGDDAWYTVSLWGLLVRSIDNQGARDPEPASLFFQASNQIPKVTINVPQHPVWLPWYLPAHFYLEWEGEDPDGNEALLSYKYIVIPESDLGGRGASDPVNPWPGLPPPDHDSSGVDHGAPPIGYWSEWVRADCTYVTDLNMSDYAGSEEYLYIFITAKDEGGAVLPPELFGLHYNLNRNLIRFKVGGTGEGIPIIVDGGLLGRRSSEDPTDYESRIGVLFSGAEVLFSFWGLENPAMGRTADVYRYYFDNPDDPGTSTWDHWTPVDPIRRTDHWPEWIVKFPVDHVPFAPELGPHVFVVEVQDINEVVTHCEFHFEVLEDPDQNPERSILLIDDNMDDGLEPAYAWREQSEDSMWTHILDGYNWEVFDTGPTFDEKVSARLVGSATTVIWAADEDKTENTQLFRLCTEYGNFLHPYVQTGGNLIIIGRNPIYAHAYWPDGWPVPDNRELYHCLDFRPRVSIDDSTSTYNFNWEIFGIKEMCVPYDPVSFSTMWPCKAGWDTVETRTIPGYAPWDGVFDNAFFITALRGDIEVQRLYGVIPLDGEGVPGSPDCTRWLAVYVPGDETRGHAAYIGFPPWLCDHEQVKTVIRQLLGLFGELPMTP